MYTTIIHPLRKKLGLTLKEYIILDAVYLISYLEGRKAVPREMAEMFDMTTSNVQYIVNKLIRMGYLQKNRYNRHVSVTEITKIAFFKN